MTSLLSRLKVEAFAYRKEHDVRFDVIEGWQKYEPKVREIFGKLDRGGKGKVDKSDYAHVIGVHTKLLAEFGLELSEETFDTIDLDDDGYITWEELLVFVHAQSNQEKGLHKSNLDLQRELVTKEVELSQTLRDALQWKKQVERLHQQALELKEVLKTAQQDSAQIDVLHEREYSIWQQSVSMWKGVQSSSA